MTADNQTTRIRVDFEGQFTLRMFYSTKEKILNLRGLFVNFIRSEQKIVLNFQRSDNINVNDLVVDVQSVITFREIIKLKLVLV